MDYSKMKATKDERPQSSNISVSSKDIKKAKSHAKKLGVSFIIVLVFLAVGLVGGFFGTKLITKNDTYEMVAYGNGQTDVYIGKGEENKTYTELGVKCISFGKDVSSKYKVTYFYRSDLTQEEKEVEKVDENVEGIYYAVYTAPSAKYSTVRLIRNIIVLKEEDDG